IGKDHYFIKNTLTGDPIERQMSRIDWDFEETKKGGYPHFMLKEIHQGASAVTAALQIDEREIKQLAQMIHESDRTFLIGIGTTYYVSLAGQYYFSSLADKFIPAISCDEFEHLGKIDKKTLVIAASQSGETYDTLRALRYAKARGGKTAAIVNVMGSTMAREVDLAIIQGAGPEICVLSTKAAFSQIAILIRLALEVASLEGTITQNDKDEMYSQLHELPDKLRTIYNQLGGKIRTIATKYSKIKNWLFIGRGIYNPVALESALKFKEVSYLHAEGMPGGFLKHGTIALIDDDMYTLAFIPTREEADLFDFTISNVQEIKARNGFVIGFHFGEESHDKLFGEEIILPKAPKLIAPFLHLTVGQLLAYFTAVSLKRNVDQPRALAKSVTVA
ncbi:MAG: SIS domain-containing protein, partial [Candidatus Tectomicrobia bacterium]|nr:SIS domain-containing protein [Candidatus Tectomicrobia bacterium]